MKILGIETSCDETAAAVVELSHIEGDATLLSNVVASSMDLHAAYGGVVPEIAARSHIESIIPVINEALRIAKYGQGFGLEKKSGKLGLAPPPSTFHLPPSSDLWDQIDGIAVTYGAGLGGSLLVGVTTARTYAMAKNKPLYAINHVEGHIYANFITKTALEGYVLPSGAPEFPMLGLIVSGGHSQLVLWRDHFDYTLLGQTRDDAIGEAFDKVAKMLGLPYPGGPSIGKKAQDGDPFAYSLPKAKLEEPYGFSFSGPKTAVLRCCQQAIGESFAFPSHQLPERLSEQQKADIAASFQRVAVETVVDKTVNVFKEFGPKSVVIGGGVAASPELRRQLTERLPIEIKYTDMKLCTDNGAMIAALGCYRALLDQPQSDPLTLAIQPNLSM